MIWERILDIFAAASPHRRALALANAGMDAIDRARAEWAIGIHDPDKREPGGNAQFCRTQIDRYIRAGLGWTWEPPYAGDGDFEWCGAFAAHCWSSIKPAIRKTYFASTYRLDRWARGQSVNGSKNKRPSDRLLAELDEHSTELPFAPQPGDILLIGPAGSGYGKHICLVESYADGVFQTIEGNGTGRAPNGKRWQGVVRAERYLGTQGHTSNGVPLKVEWYARRLIRPSAEDLAP